MNELQTEHIELVINYRSQANNGWPIISFYVNDILIDTIHADNDKVNLSFNAPIGDWKFSAIHWGKNPHNESSPDKFFEITDITINKVNISRIIHRGIQYPQLPPWEKAQVSWVGNLYMGHNGKIEWNFTSPIYDYLRQEFNTVVKPIVGQETTREVLEQTKKFFNL